MLGPVTVLCCAELCAELYSMPVLSALPVSLCYSWVSLRLVRPCGCVQLCLEVVTCTGMLPGST